MKQIDLKPRFTEKKHCEWLKTKHYILQKTKKGTYHDKSNWEPGNAIDRTNRRTTSWWSARVKTWQEKLCSPSPFAFSGAACCTVEGNDIVITWNNQKMQPYHLVFVQNDATTLITRVYNSQYPDQSSRKHSHTNIPNTPLCRLVLYPGTHLFLLQQTNKQYYSNWYVWKPCGFCFGRNVFYYGQKSSRSRLLRMFVGKYKMTFTIILHCSRQQIRFHVRKW